MIVELDRSVRFEPREQERLDEFFQRHAVLQSQRDRDGEAVPCNDTALKQEGLRVRLNDAERIADLTPINDVCYTVPHCPGSHGDAMERGLARAVVWFSAVHAIADDCA